MKNLWGYVKHFFWWLGCWITLTPHFYVGGKDDPYLKRWYVIPRNKWFNIYLHKFCRDDEDRALHDHPWDFWSLMLWGSYTEITGETHFEDGPIQIQQQCRERSMGQLAFMPAEHRHRVVLNKLKTLRLGERPVPCWTMVFTGGTRRVWGFWCPKGFVPYDRFGSQGDIGKGCDG